MSRIVRPLLPVLLLLTLAPHGAAGEEPVDLEALTRIRDEGFHHSQVMQTVRHLTDEIGPRITGSPQMKAANEWTRQQLADWGLANAHLEPYHFGRGWSFTGASLTLLGAQREPLHALPKGFTPGTNGPVQGALLRVKIESEKDLDQYRGKLAGKILMLDDAHDFSKDKAAARRYSDEEIAALGRFEVPRERSSDRVKRFLDRQKLRRATNKLFTEEKVAATLSASPAPWGLMRVGNGGSPDPDEDPGPPALVVAAESYDRLLRLLEGSKPVEVEVNVQAAFHADDLNAYNTVAEIPGTDKRGELVMLGAHLDSWHTGTGATDNAAGCAVAMEAVRILKALGLRPRRTIRIALWSGEEEGLLGSAAYAAQHFGSRPEPTDPEQKKLPAMLRKSTGPLALKPEQAKVSAYFNLDNGSGKVRGLYSQENAAVVPIFEAWLRPLRDLGADTLTERPTGGTDHLSFDEVGVPGFQFIQDELDYMNLTHHTDMDVYDHLERDDLMQASVVMAAVVYDAAMRPEKLPRKPLPKE